MLSRRDVLLGSVAAGIAARPRRAAAFADPSQPSTPVNFRVPAGACDCHLHIFGDPKRFPLSPSRIDTPERASIDQARALHRSLHIDRVVLVQPSIFGTDNACLLEALRQLGSRARAVAVIDAATGDRTLDELQRAGVRGVRINLGTAGVTDATVARRSLGGRLQAAGPGDR